MDGATKSAILLGVVAVLAPVLMGLSGRRRRSNHPALRFVLWGMSAMYFPLMSYVLTYLATYISSNSNAEGKQMVVLIAVVLTQFLRAKADMAALAVAAVASPVAGDDDINSLKIRPSMENLVYSFWVAGLVVHSIFFIHKKQSDKKELQIMALLISPLWLLGGGGMVLRFASFKKATGSFALGRNVQLIEGYMLQLKEYYDTALSPEAVVPRLIVTGERNRDVEESPMGYRVKRSTLEDEHRRLVTLDQVWSYHVLPEPMFRDLCLSFALFKCLRRRFAGYRLAEAGSSWALRFVTDGLLGQQDDYVRVFRVIADELVFVRDFYYSSLPVASLGTASASLHFFISFLILALLCILMLFLTFILARIMMISRMQTIFTNQFYLLLLSFVLAVVNACSEITEMVSSVRSNWTKMSIIGHYIRCRNTHARRIFSSLLRCRSPKVWNDDIGQTELLLIKPAGPPFLNGRQPWAHLFKQLFCLTWRNKPVIKVPPEVKAAVLSSFRRSEGKLSAGEAAVGRQASGHGISWACEVTTTTDVILLWHVATSLFEIRFSSSRASSSSSSSSTKNNILVTGRLSRYCMYLVAEAPDLLPETSAWTKHRYEEVKKKTDEVLSTGRSHAHVPDQAAKVYGQLVDAFSSDAGSHELLKKGAKLGKQLVEKAEKPGEGEDAVWELLAEFWSEMVLYIAPSDNVKSHIEALQRGGELVTLLWALLLHAGITTRPAWRHVSVVEP